MDGPIRFQSFVFYPDRGELIFRDGRQPEKVSRLAPQPSRLLSLLLKKYPDIVSQQEIKEVIWPEVQVDFERSLHYCIRQIRSALDDNASDPRFIETIPRRGYRWIAKYELNTPASSIKSIRYPISGLLVFALAVVLGVWYFLAKSPAAPASEVATPIRVAVMSFQPAVGTSSFAGNDIALQLVESLTNDFPDMLEVIGPTTTGNYASDQFGALIRDFDIDLILHGRFPPSDSSGRLLAEVIRAEDGAHVWVKYFDPGADNGLIVETISGGIKESLALE